MLRLQFFNPPQRIIPVRHQIIRCRRQPLIALTQKPSQNRIDQTLRMRLARLDRRHRLVHQSELILLTQMQLRQGHPQHRLQPRHGRLIDRALYPKLHQAQMAHRIETQALHIRPRHIIDGQHRQSLLQ